VSLRIQLECQLYSMESIPSVAFRLLQQDSRRALPSQASSWLRRPSRRLRSRQRQGAVARGCLTEMAPPAKSAAGGSGKASLGGKAAASSKGGGKGPAAKDKTAAAVSAKEAAHFRRQLSELKTQVMRHLLLASWHRHLDVACRVGGVAAGYPLVTQAYEASPKVVSHPLPTLMSVVSACEPPE
jgi:hypothetical protein